MRVGGRWVAIVFFGGLAALSLLVFSKHLSDVLPQAVATHIARNNEGLVLAVVLGAWIQFIRPRLVSSYAMPIALLVGAGFLLGGLWLTHGPLTKPGGGVFITQDETAYALAVLIPYVQLLRPVPLWAYLVPVVGFVVPVVIGSNQTITNLAEFFTALVLVPITVDIVDSGILDGSPARVGRGALWTLLMAVCVVAMFKGFDRRPDTVIDEVVRWVYRGAEMFIAAGFLTLYFSVLRHDLRPRRPVAAPPVGVH